MAEIVWEEKEEKSTPMYNTFSVIGALVTLTMTKSFTSTWHNTIACFPLGKPKGGKD
jgi:hypothetical protein